VSEKERDRKSRVIREEIKKKERKKERQNDRTKIKL
jgi:hypothetical protein